MIKPTSTPTKSSMMPKVEDKIIRQPFGDRGGVVIEPMADRPVVRKRRRNARQGADREAVRSGAIEIVPKSWEKTFFNWMENIQPWCVSRQLWWGHRIPAWYGPEFEASATRVASVGLKAFVAETEEQALMQAQAYLDELKATSHPLFQNAIVELESDGSEREPGLTNAPFKYEISRDPDVLDTWFSSALWPFVTLGCPMKMRRC